MATPSWLTTVESPAVRPDLARPELWLADLAFAALECARYAEMIDPAELAQADRFRFERDRTAFIIRRGLVRCLLADRLGCHPGEVCFRWNPQGKPELKEDTDWRFNASHSGQFILIGIVRGCDIGVDVEEMRRFADQPNLAARILSPEEWARFRALTALEQQPAFFRYWTRKEAVLKARGVGLSVDPRDVPVELPEPGASSGSSTRVTLEGGRYVLGSFDPSPGYMGAVALEA